MKMINMKKMMKTMKIKWMVKIYKMKKMNRMCQMNKILVLYHKSRRVVLTNSWRLIPIMLYSLRDSRRLTVNPWPCSYFTCSIKYKSIKWQIRRRPSHLMMWYKHYNLWICRISHSNFKVLIRLIIDNPFESKIKSTNSKLKRSSMGLPILE